MCDNGWGPIRVSRKFPWWILKDVGSALGFGWKEREVVKGIFSIFFFRMTVVGEIGWILYTCWVRWMHTVFI